MARKRFSSQARVAFPHAFVALLAGGGGTIAALTMLLASPALGIVEGHRSILLGIAFALGVLVSGGTLWVAHARLRGHLSAVIRELQESAGRGELNEALGAGAMGEYAALGALVARARCSSSVENLQCVVRDIRTHLEQSAENTRTLSGNSTQRTQLFVETAISVEELEYGFGQVHGNMQVLGDQSGKSLSAVGNMNRYIAGINDQVALLTQQSQDNSARLDISSESIAHTAGSVTSLSENLATAASGMTQMDATLREITGTLGQGTRALEKTSGQARDGQEAVQKTEVGMQRIHESFLATSATIRSFEKQIRKIASFTGVIEEVNERTNLLALNAAIIAAQAGEHGRGFAVVAASIKKLSEQTSQSTDEIGTLIKAFQDQAAAAMKALSQSEMIINLGLDLSQSSGEALVRIQESAAESYSVIRRVEQAVGEISTTVHSLSERVDSIAEQAHRIDEANRAQALNIRQVSATVAETRTVAEALTASAREQMELSKRVEEFTGQVGELIGRTRESIHSSEEQTRNLVKAIQEIQRLSTRDVEATKEIDVEIGSLTRRCEDLGRELTTIEETWGVSPPGDGIPRDLPHPGGR
ncbi:MAG: methyl-accepting chemotaxis protein [Candidatus Methylomirabilia bacterium]